MKYLLILFFLSCNLQVGVCQNFLNLYDGVISDKNQIDSYSSMLNKAKSGNSSEFIYLSYFINSNNIMFQKTLNKKYLGYNNDIINEINNSQNYSSNGEKKGWTAKFQKGHMNDVMNGKEYMLYESYLFRYIAEYEYLRRNSKFASSYSSVLPLLVTTFQKWYGRSQNEFGDNSLFMDSRVYNGSHWATFAIYMFKITGESKYSTIFKIYDTLLRTNLEKKKYGSTYFYIWNGVYPKSYNNHFKMKITSQYQLQDVSHGNHVIQYVTTAYKLKTGFWSLQDIKYFSNTLKFKIWNKNTKRFSDLIDGGKSNNKLYSGRGRNQSDGWMKLIPYDSSLRDIYMDFYKNNRKLIDNSFLNLQFYANMYK